MPDNEHMIPEDETSLYAGLEDDPLTEADKIASEPYMKDAMYEVITGDDSGDEYEYKPISESSNAVVRKLREIVAEYYVFIGAVALIGLLSLMYYLSQNINAVAIAIIFSIIVVLGLVILYFAWSDKRKAQEKYEHAKKVFEPVQRKAIEETLEEERKAGKKKKGGKGASR